MDLSFKNRRKPKIGMVLISDPFSMDDYFGRSVVYICSHNETGTFGFVLNNYLGIDLFDITKNFPKIESRVSLGGPVEPESVFYIHTLGEKLKGSEEIADGIYFGGDYDELTSMIKNEQVKTNEIRFFIGYSGWDAGQLNEELKSNNWIVAPVLNPLEVMDTNIDNLWQRFMKREGKKFEILANSTPNYFEN